MQAQEPGKGNEIDVFNINLTIQQVGMFDFPIAYDTKSKVVYFPVVGLFELIKIKNQTSEDGKLISGFFCRESYPYVIDFQKKEIKYKQKKLSLGKTDFVYDVGIWYLSRQIIESVFGINSSFDYRNLLGSISADFEFPVVTLMKQEKNREMLSNNNETIEKFDRIYAKQFHLFRFGNFDWSASSAQAGSLSRSSVQWSRQNYFNLGFGSELMGGEADIWLNYDENARFDLNQQRYQWWWANDNSSIIKQVRLGRVPLNAVSTIQYPIDGITLSNAPIKSKNTLGEYLISDFTNPNWLVELYINRVLVSFVRADASGFFSFKIPITYGVTGITLRFYGPNGEERSRQKELNIPYNFLPKKTFEYKVTAGHLLDSLGSKFLNASFGYGLTRNITIAAGVEYLQTMQQNKPYIPYFSLSFVPFSKLLVLGEYDHKVRTSLQVNLRLNSATLDMKYIKLDKNQTAIRNRYLEDRLANLSMPIRISKVSALIRTSFHQNVFPSSTYNDGQFMFSCSYKGFSTNVAHFITWSTYTNPSAYSNFGLSFKLKNGLDITTGNQYNFSTKKLVSFHLRMVKKVFKNGFARLNYDNYFLSANSNTISLSFNYQFNFINTSVSALVKKSFVQFTENVSGSISTGGNKGNVYFNNQGSVGICRVAIYAFLDTNNNGILDAGEPMVDKLNVKCDQGKVITGAKDSIIRIVDLSPFRKYNLHFDETKFSNPSWKIKTADIQLTTDPNQFKKILVPVSVLGEINGVLTNKKSQGQGRMYIEIYTHKDSLVAHTLTEEDGYFSYLGLLPGKYIIKGNKTQLMLLHKDIKPVSFVIHPSVEGEIKEIGKIKLIDQETSLKDNTPVQTEPVPSGILKNSSSSESPDYTSIDCKIVRETKPETVKKIMKEEPKGTMPSAAIVESKYFSQNQRNNAFVNDTRKDTFDGAVTEEGNRDESLLFNILKTDKTTSLSDSVITAKKLKLISCVLSSQENSKSINQMISVLGPILLHDKTLNLRFIIPSSSSAGNLTTKAFPGEIKNYLSEHKELHDRISVYFINDEISEKDSILLGLPSSDYSGLVRKLQNPFSKLYNEVIVGRIGSGSYYLQAISYSNFDNVKQSLAIFNRLFKTYKISVIHHDAYYRLCVVSIESIGQAISIANRLVDY